MLDYEKLTIEDIRSIHLDALVAFGGRYGEHEPGLIEFMADKPFQVAFGQELYPGLFMKAAVYMHGFSTAQYFVDGNKRTAYLCAFVFLKLNGYTVLVENDDLFDTALAVANKKISMEELAKWLEEHSLPNE
jgi:death on curing protein